MRRKKPNIQLEHRTFGFGTVKYRKATDYGDALVIEFADRARTILLDADGSDPWVSREDALAVFQIAPEMPIPKEPPRKAIRVRTADEIETVEIGEE